MNYLTTKSCRPSAGMLSDMDRMFNQLFDAPVVHTSRSFAADIAKTENGYRIQADLPGFGPEDVDVRVEDKLLIIEAKELEQADEKKEDGTSWFLKERRSGNRKRSFLLPENVDRSSVEAAMKNGSLVVDIAKKPEAKPLNIKVRSK